MGSSSQFQVSSAGNITAVNITASGSTIRFSNLTTNGFVKTISGNGTLSVSSSVNLNADVTGTLPVGNGGTGATTLTSFGVLYGNGTSAIGATTAGTNGQILFANTGAAPTFLSLSGDTTVDASGVVAINVNSVALTTDTTGNYVGTVTTGNGLTGGAAGSEGTAISLVLDIVSSIDSTGSTSSFSGLEFQGGGTQLALLQGCTNGEVMGWNDTSGVWQCTGQGGLSGGTTGYATYWTGTASLGAEAQLAPVRGGFGIDTSASSGVPTVSAGTWSISSSLTTSRGGTGTTTSFDPGSIVFAGGSGIYTQDNAGFFYDDTNNFLGLGDVTPDATIDIDSTRTSGTLFGVGAPSSTTLAGSLTGSSLNLSTNYTATGQSVTGYDTTLPAVTNTGAGTYNYRGFNVTGGTLVQNTAAGTNTFTGAFITNPNITQTTGTVTANGVNVTNGTITTNGTQTGYNVTTGTIPTAGTQTGFNVAASGVAAGTLYGMNISSITAGGGTETAINIGTGWDNGIVSSTVGTSSFAGNVGFGDTSPAALLTVGSGDLFQVNSAGNISTAVSTGVGLTITNTGTSNTLLINDTASDSSPFVIDAAGQVGIGTSTPAVKVNIFGVDNAIRLSYDSSNYTTVSAASNGDFTIVTSNTTESAILLGTALAEDTSIQYVGNAVNYYAGLDDGTDSFMIGSGSTVGSSVIASFNSSGDIGIGIGSATPGARLYVADDVASDYTLEVLNDGNNSNRWGMRVQAGANSGAGTLIQFSDGDGTDVGEITFSGTTTTYSTASDRRLKQDIRPTAYSLADLMQVQVRDYEFIVDGRTSTGFIAQDLYEVYPYPVSRPDDPNNQWGVDYGLITPLIVKGVQEEYALITALQGENNTQSNDIADLNLAVSDNITTINGLQDAVENDLQDVNGDINALENKDTLVQNDIAALTVRTDILENQMENLIEQVQTLSEFYTAFDLGNAVMKDLGGDVDLLNGKLKARVLETGALVIENNDADAKTIGTKKITPVLVDSDNDGNDDNTGSDGISIDVDTIALTPNSKIFTSFGDNPGAYSWTKKESTSGDYTGFIIYLSEPVTEDVEVNWWIVEEK